MRYLFLLISLTLASNGQDAGSTEPIQAKPKAGATAGRLVVPIVKAPAPGDRLVIGTDTNALKITVITPDGRRINSANADANGFDWSESPDTPPIGSTDGGLHAIVSFKGAGATGNYTIDFASRALPKQAAVEAWYVTDRDQYDQMFKQMPGAQRIGPVPFDSSKRTQDLALSLADDEAGTLIDIVASNPNTDVSLKLPGGAILTPRTPKSDAIEWKTVSSRDQVDPPGAMFGIGGFLLPRDGTHHVIMLRTAAKGNYSIHLELSGSASGQAEAMLLPIERLLTDATAEIGKPPKLPGGTILLQPAGLPYDCFVGDKLDLAVRLAGDPVAGPVRFQVKVETRARLPYKETGPQEYAPPKVVETPVAFTLGSDGWYRGTLVPKDQGVMRVSVTASGTSAAGKRFTEETLLTDVMVAPVVATLVSLTERAVDDNGNGRPDRLEVTATLDVVNPGKYEMRFGVADQGSLGTSGSTSVILAAGRQKLTASVAADDLFKSLKDGPYTVKIAQLFRPEGNSFGNFVKATLPPLTTAAYKRDQWDRGTAFGEEKVELRPIRPGRSGKFTAVEAVWSAVVEGGSCSWEAMLYAGKNASMELIQAGSLPAGRLRFSFEFDTALLARSSKGDGFFSADVQCFNGTDATAKAWLPVKLDPSQFEPAESQWHIFSRAIIRTKPGQAKSEFSILETLDRAAKKWNGEVTYRATSVPAGLTPSIRDGMMIVATSSEVKAGRYYIGLEATAGDQKATGIVVVDVLPDSPPVRSGK